MTAAIEGILETALYADDLDAAEAFYGGVLSLEKVTRQANRHLFYRCGPGILLIFNPAETAKPVPAGALPVPSHGATGPGHVCFRVRGEEMDGIVERLRTAGVLVVTIDNAPVNALSADVRGGLMAALAMAEGDAEIRAVVVRAVSQRLVWAFAPASSAAPASSPAPAPTGCLALAWGCHAGGAGPRRACAGRHPG